MDEKKVERKFPVRQWMVPDYWPEFHCLAAGCQRNCCGGYWQILFSRSDYLKIKHAEKSPEMESLTVGHMYRTKETDPKQYAGFKLNDAGICHFQREDGLCGLQCECGEGVLPEVCRKFPRIENSWLTGYAHRSCSIGCEAVLHLLWERKAGLGFVDGPLERKDWKMVRTKLPPELLAEYPAIWELCIDILQDRRIRLSARVIALGALVKNMEAHSEEEGAAWRGWAAAQREALESVYPALEALPGDRKWFLASNVKRMHNLNQLSSLERSARETIMKNLQGEALDTYADLERQFRETFGDLDWFFENMIVNQFFENGLPMGNLEPKDMWRYYVQLCCVCFSFLKFCAIASRPRTKEELINVLVQAGRSVYHSSRNMEALVKEMHETGDDTLAAVAILLDN